MGDVIGISQEPEPLVRAQVVAKYLAIAVSTVLAKARNGTQPGARIVAGGARKRIWRFNMREVVEGQQREQRRA